MDKNLSALKPALVWKHFAQIARIPRPSSHEEKIRKYVMDFAREKGLECKEDAAHNVYVRKPASKGMEDRKGVLKPGYLADVVVLSTGVRPDTAAFEASGVECERGAIVVDGHGRTNLPDVYAAGDATVSTDAVTGVAAVRRYQTGQTKPAPFGLGD